MFIVVFLLGFITLLLFANSTRRKKNYPKGPWRLPIIGNLHQLAGESPQKALLKMSETYGPIFSLKFGTYETIVINDVKLMREAMSHPGMAGRPEWPQFVGRTNGIRKGLIVTEGKEHTEQRKFALKILKQLGMGARSTEGLIVEEIQELMENIKLENGKPIELDNLFNAATVNALMIFLFGQRKDQKDPEFNKNMHYINGLTPNKKSMKALMIVFPWLIKISKYWSGYEDTMKGFKSIENYIKTIIKEHEKSRIENQPRDYIDAYFDEIEKTKDQSSTFYGETGRDRMVWMAFDIFAGGVETTRHSVAWSCVIFASLQDCQTKFRDEMKKVTGNREPSLSDRRNMPYVEAFIHEVLRYSSLLYFGVPRRTTEEVEIVGYKIPAGIKILGNLYAVHFDEKYWGDPENFRPERFINQDGSIQKHEASYAFGSGKRICPGENFARDEMFLFTTQLISNFQILPDYTNPEPPHFRTFNTTFTCNPVYNKVCFVKLK